MEFTERFVKDDIEDDVKKQIEDQSIDAYVMESLIRSLFIKVKGLEWEQKRLEREVEQLKAVNADQK